MLAWTIAGAALWIVGALLPLSWQLPFWAAALGVELLGTRARVSACPVWAACSSASWDVSGPHIAERTALFVLIALGEGLLVTGFAFVAKESSPTSIIAMAAAFVAAAATWWIYFDHGERIGAEAIEASDEPGRLARTAYTWIHLAIIGGIVLMSVGDKESLGHPHAHGFAATVVMLGGPFLFLVGTVLFRRVLEQRWARAHARGIAASSCWPPSPRCSMRSASPSRSRSLVAVAAGETVGRLRRGRRSGG